MDDLIYKFLLQSGYPRAAIVSNIPSKLGNVQPGSANACIIVDPESATYLAAISVVEAVSDQGLQEAGNACLEYAASLDQCRLQCFVIRVDMNASDPKQQISFYRVRQNKQLVPLSVQSFPDIQSLKVSRMLREKALPPSAAALSSNVHSTRSNDRLPWLSYLPGVILLLLGALNGLMARVAGEALIDTGSAILLLGAAFLFTITLCLRYYRR